MKSLTRIAKVISSNSSLGHYHQLRSIKFGMNKSLFGGKMHCCGYSSSSSTFSSLNDIFDKATPDPYRAVRVEIRKDTPITDFESTLERYLQVWKAKSSTNLEFSTRVRSVHLKIDAERSELIPICLKKFGFEFHHCQRDYIYLHKWLPTEEKSTYPPYCQHYVGTGGCVVDFEKEEILLITEKISIRTDIPKHVKPFKIPGGQLDYYEFIEEGVCREVREETNVKTNFIGILGFRYKKAFRFGNPDIYYICLLEPKSQQEKLAISACPNEIDICKWVPLETYYTLEGLTPVQQHARKLVKRYVEARKTNPELCDSLLFKSTLQNEKGGHLES